jgi:hypothetical protein
MVLKRSPITVLIRLSELLRREGVGSGNPGQFQKRPVIHFQPYNLAGTGSFTDASEIAFGLLY